MWLVLPTGFISMVQDRGDKSMVWVRARIKEDIANTFPLHADKIITKIGADYIYRLLIPKEVAATVMWNQVMDLDYDSHAKEVMNRRSHPNTARMTAYYACWTALAKMQPYAPYSKTPRGAGGYTPKSGMTSQGWKNDLYKGKARETTTTWQDGKPYDWSKHPQSATFVDPGLNLVDDEIAWPTAANDKVLDAIHGADGNAAKTEEDTLIDMTDEEWEQYVSVRENERRGPGNRAARRKRRQRSKR